MDKVRLGFIGAGWWAAEYQMPYFAGRDDVTLASVSRLGQRELAQVRERFGFAHATEDYRDLLKQDLDAVVVASPHGLHFEHAQAALTAGLHVLVEKPMTTRARDAQALVDLAQQKGKHLLVPQGWNFTPYVRQASQLVRNGEIGEVRHIVCQMASALSDLFSGQPMVETQGQLFRPPASTWADPNNAGGYGWGQLSHALGVLFALADVAPSEVFAWMGRSPSGADYYDAINVRFTNGATGVISGSATLPKASGAQHDRGKGYQIDIRIFGSEGTLLLDVERERCEIRRNDGRDTMIPMKPGDGDYPATAPMAAFVDLILGRSAENAMTGKLGLRTVQVLEAAYQSAAANGVCVQIADL
jgi:predicted dehydrogenase